MSETKTTEPYPAISHARQAPMGDTHRKSVALNPHTEHGALIDHHVPQEDAVQAEPDLLWSRIRHYFRDPLSEFFGVFILILFGDGVVAQVVLSDGAKGSYQSISWGWG
jgi:aquaglyceroporin related protein, other eukaryote